MPGDDPPKVYTNLVRIHGGAYDVTIDFQQQPPGEEGKPPPQGETQVRVSMSWSHLKSMIPLMVKLVAEYEKGYGTIPAPGFDDFSKG